MKRNEKFHHLRINGIIEVRKTAGRPRNSYNITTIKNDTEILILVLNYIWIVEK